MSTLIIIKDTSAKLSALEAVTRAFANHGKLFDTSIEFQTRGVPSEILINPKCEQDHINACHNRFKSFRGNILDIEFVISPQLAVFTPKQEVTPEEGEPVALARLGVMIIHVPKQRAQFYISTDLWFPMWALNTVGTCTNMDHLNQILGIQDIFNFHPDEQSYGEVLAACVENAMKENFPFNR